MMDPTPKTRWAVPRAVVLDLDGLLVDSEPLYFAACRNALARVGLDLTEVEYNDHLCGRPNAVAEEYLAAKFGRAFDRRAFRRRWLEGFRGRIEAGDLAAKAGAERFLTGMAASGLRRIVATGSDRADAERMVAAAGLETWIEDLVTAEDVPRGKPAPDPFLEAAKRISCSADECVVLEDSPAGVRAAIAAGMRVIVVPDRLAPDESLVIRADGVICADLDEATGVVTAWRGF